MHAAVFVSLGVHLVDNFIALRLHGIAEEIAVADVAVAGSGTIFRAKVVFGGAVHAVQTVPRLLAFLQLNPAASLLGAGGLPLPTSEHLVLGFRARLIHRLEGVQLLGRRFGGLFQLDFVVELLYFIDCVRAAHVVDLLVAAQQLLQAGYLSAEFLDLLDVLLARGALLKFFIEFLKFFENFILLLLLLAV